MSEKKLNLNRENIKKEPATPEEAAKQASKRIAEFYETMGNCLINLVAIHNDIAKTIREISTDSNDIAFYQKKIALKMEAVNAMEIEEQEAEDDDDSPANSEHS